MAAIEPSQALLDKKMIHILSDLNVFDIYLTMFCYPNLGCNIQDSDNHFHREQCCCSGPTLLTQADTGTTVTRSPKLWPGYTQFGEMGQVNGFIELIVDCKHDD